MTKKELAIELVKTLQLVEIAAGSLEIIALGFSLDHPDAALDLTQRFASDRDKLEELIAEQYEKVYSEEDLAKIVAFFTSPEGKKWVSSQQIMEGHFSNCVVKYGEEVIRDILEKHKIGLNEDELAPSPSDPEVC